MAQLFPRSSNQWVRRSLVAAAILGIGFVTVVAMWFRSPYSTWVHIARAQNVPFSHKHHADELGIDCRFCHTSAEKSAYAGIPSTETCMKCHSVIWKDSTMLEPVRESSRTGKPMVWKRVHDLPDHVYFDHSIHLNKGIACVSCHGQVDQMPLVSKSKSLRMEWCLECHRNPEKNLRPSEEVFNPNWKTPDDLKELQKVLAKKYHVQSVTHCNACHR
ncbi:MAG: cytochrome C [Candidatus Omnitrophica bacterium CG1_02_46_14]|nr:MAG: cytochrome C [Candidatus Omnitrophica bacterium CG1_02_46_14]